MRFFSCPVSRRGSGEQEPLQGQPGTEFKGSPRPDASASLPSLPENRSEWSRKPPLPPVLPHWPFLTKEEACRPSSPTRPLYLAQSCRTLRGAKRRDPESTVFGDECCDARSQHRRPCLLQALGAGLGGNRTEERGPEHGGQGPPAAQVCLQACPNKESRNTGRAASRRTPEPPNPCSSGWQLGGCVAERG